MAAGVGRRQRVVVALLVCLVAAAAGVCVTGVPVAAEEAQAAQGRRETPARAGGADAFREIVDFVIQRDPVLRAQRSAMEAAQRLGAVQLGDSTTVPAFAQSQLLKAELERANEVAAAQEQYMKLERGLVSEVLNRVYEILSLVNQTRGQEELYRMLQQRLAATERQVQAGLVEPKDLWDATDRLIEVRTNMANLGDQLQTLKRQVAFSYGGEDWRELLALLDKLAAGS